MGEERDWGRIIKGKQARVRECKDEQVATRVSEWPVLG